MMKINLNQISLDLLGHRSEQKEGGTKIKLKFKDLRKITNNVFKLVLANGPIFGPVKD